MTNFEKVAASPEALGEFLASLPVADGPWEEAFHRIFCDGCPAENCDAENCPHNAERSNPTWWLTGTTEDKREVPLDKLPEPLREIKQNHPAVRIYKTSPVSHGLKGNLHYMEVGAAMMFELGKLLWAGEGRYRVTIECDPETGKFEAKREDIEKETAPASETEGRQDAATLSAENRQRQEYLNLARQFHLPISAAIEHYDTLSQRGT